MEVITSMYVGFFDPDGYYFNPEGYDELGGYYDDLGVYRDPDFGFGEEGAEKDLYQDIAINQHIESILPFIREAPDGIEFTAVLTNFPYQTTKEQLEDELKKHKIEFEKLDAKFDGKEKLLKANVVVKSKKIAESILLLHGKIFLSRSLKVEFPDFNLDLIVGETDLLKVENPAASKATNPKPNKEEQKHKETKKDESSREGEKSKQVKKEEEENEDGFIIEHFKSSTTPFVPKPRVKYQKRNKPQ